MIEFQIPRAEAYELIKSVESLIKVCACFAPQTPLAPSLIYFMASLEAFCSPVCDLPVDASGPSVVSGSSRDDAPV